MVDVDIRRLHRDELLLAAGVLARGMRDNPIHVAVFGDDPYRRTQTLETLFGAYLPMMTRAPISAYRAGTLVGVLGMVPPGHGHRPNLPAALGGLRVLAPLVRCDPATCSRLLRWLGAWARRDPQEPHWHLGPVAVEAGLQRRGIGRQMMDVFCARMDRERAAAYLETDKLENVAFYRRFGFETIAEATVLGTRNWFMRRAPRPVTPS